MDLEKFKIKINQELIENNINIKINEEEFYKFMKNTLEWNTKINLTNITNENEFIMKHIIDSLIILKYIKNDSILIDIGTGGGFPGLPIKIANKTIKATLIDSINKKLITVNDNIEKLNLNNIEVIHTRAEDLAQNQNYRENFDFATTRAVSNLSTILEYMLPFLKIGGQAICMKGPNIEEELKNSEKALKVLGGTIRKIENFKIDDFERNIIIVEKIKSSPKEYPRSGGKPVKNPII